MKKFPEWWEEYCIVGGWTNPFEKYARQIRNLPQIGMNMKNILKKHHLDKILLCPKNSNPKTVQQSILHFLFEQKNAKALSAVSSAWVYGKNPSENIQVSWEFAPKP